MKSVLVLLLAAVVVGVATASAADLDVDAEGMDSSLDQLDQLDESVFSTEPVQAVPPPPAASSDADAEAPLASAALNDDAESSLGEADESGAHDSEAAYSFRAMEAATDVAGSGLISEKAAETHRMAQKFLKNNAVSADDMFAEINREQQILAAKRALVSRQKESITESVKSLKRLASLITENQGILKKNELALRGASDDLLKLIAKYQAKLKAGLAPIPAPKPKKAAPKPVKKVAAKKAKKAKKSKRAVTKTRKVSKTGKKAKATKKTAKKKGGKKGGKLAKKAGKAAAAKNLKLVELAAHADEADEDESADEEESDDEDESESEEDSDDEAEAEQEEDTEDELDEASLLEMRAGLLNNDNIDIDLGLGRSSTGTDDTDTDEDLLDSDSEVDMHAGNLLPGLGAPPKLYKPEEDLAI